MRTLFPAILNNPAVLERTSPATRRLLYERVNPPAATERYLEPALYALLEAITATVLPQDAIGTRADVAACIDRRLLEGTNAGWRFADLPADGEAYRQGLRCFAAMLQKEAGKAFGASSTAERERYVRRIASGVLDASADFALSKWFAMVMTDTVKFWLAHPSTMQKIAYYGFADGATGTTDGPTEAEGWSAITPNQALPFEHDIETPAILTGREA